MGRHVVFKEPKRIWYLRFQHEEKPNTFQKNICPSFFMSYFGL